MKDDTAAPTSPTKKRLRSSASHSDNGGDGGELGSAAATAPATNDENSKGNDIVIAPSSTRKKRTRKNDNNDADDDDVVVGKEGADNGGGKTSAATATATANTTQQCIKVHRTIQDMICHDCVLCKMPRCESCFVCNATGHLLEEERGYCIRKVSVFEKMRLGEGSYTGMGEIGRGETSWREGGGRWGKKEKDEFLYLYRGCD